MGFDVDECGGVESGRSAFSSAEGDSDCTDEEALGDNDWEKLRRAVGGKSISGLLADRQKLDLIAVWNIRRVSVRLLLAV